MKKLKANLIVVAHPDDESIFFGGLLQKERSRPWHLVCVTDGNGDGRGRDRHQELRSAAKRLKIETVEHWDFADKYEQRLEYSQLSERLKILSPQVHTIYTHGLLGEYGHPHHQDVSYAVHRLFSKTHQVWGTAYNCMPQKRVLLTTKQFALKSEILSQIYRLETERFVHLLPAFAEEGFCQFDMKEVEAIYNTVRWQQPLNVKALKHYKWLAQILSVTAYNGLKRPF